MNDWKIARAAEDAAALHAARGWEWAFGNGVGGAVPTAADIALVLRRMVAGLKPGERAEEGRLIVERDYGDGSAVRVLLSLAEMEAE